MLESVFALLLLVFAASALVCAFQAFGLERYLRDRYPQLQDDRNSPRNLLKWQFWAERVVFPQRQLRTRLASGGIEDAPFDVRIAAVVRWNRLSIALYPAVWVLVTAVRP